MKCSIKMQMEWWGIAASVTPCHNLGWYDHSFHTSSKTWTPLDSLGPCAHSCCNCSKTCWNGHHRHIHHHAALGSHEKCGQSCCSCSRMAHWGSGCSHEQCGLRHCNGSNGPAGLPCTHGRSDQNGCTCSTCPVHHGHIHRCRHHHHLPLKHHLQPDTPWRNVQAHYTCSKQSSWWL